MSYYGEPFTRVWLLITALVIKDCSTCYFGASPCTNYTIRRTWKFRWYGDEQSYAAALAYWQGQSDAYDPTRNIPQNILISAVGEVVWFNQKHLVLAWLNAGPEG